MSFDGDAENTLVSILTYLQIASTYIYNGYPKLKCVFGFGVTDNPCFESSHRSNKDDVFKDYFQRLGSYWQRVSQSLQIATNRLCRLTASLQHQKHKNWSNIFENIFEAADH